MKAIFALFLIVAIIGMAMAGVHHYRIDSNGNKVEGPPANAVADSAGHSGTIFDAAANGLNAVGGAIGNLFG